MVHFIEYWDIQKRRHYNVVGVVGTCIDLDIKSAYTEMLLAHHPDKNGNASTTINSIQEAYKTLIDPELRDQYDDSLKRSIQRQGFNITGDGLDIYCLDDFEMEEEEECKWLKDCPRCQFPKSIKFKESDLIENGTEDGDNGFDIIVQCESCSLWIKVKYYEINEEDDE